MKRKPYIIRSNYKYLYLPEHPHSGKQGYIAEHRVIVENEIGRFLTKSEVVHHKNGDTQDNNIDNLQLCSSPGQHIKLYHPEVVEKSRLANLGKRPKNYNRGIKSCPICETDFETTLGKSGKIFCSRECANKNLIGKKPKNTEGLKLGRGWNKGKKMTWAPKGENSPHYKHGKYSKYTTKS